MRTEDGVALVDPAHLDPYMLSVPHLRLEDLQGLAVPLKGRAPDEVEHGRTVRATGRWAGDAIVANSIAVTPASALSTDPAGYVERPTPPPRPVRAPGPPTALEHELLREGVITDRVPYGDGTLHVTADDVQRARALLLPLYGSALRVTKARFSQEQRRAADAALLAIRELDVLCAEGGGFLDNPPTESRHSIEMLWVTDRVAELLRPVVDGLVRVDTHVAAVRNDN